MRTCLLIKIITKNGHDFMNFIRFPINYKLDLVINHQLDCPNQLIIGYNQSLIYH